MDSAAYVIDESDCCGNGCANCILDANKSTSASSSYIHRLDGKINCLNTTRSYELLQIEHYVRPDILKLKFQLSDQQDAIKPTTIENDDESTTTTIMNDSSNLILYVPPGHHIMMKTISCARPYSPCSIAPEKFQFEFLVNLRPNGTMSKYIAQLRLGDLVEFKGPIGTFYHETNKYEHLLIYSNGVAVAPIIPIIEEILNNDEDMTRIHYFGCFTNIEHFYFRQQFHDYKQFWNFNGKFYLAKEKCEVEDCSTTGNTDNGSGKMTANGVWCEHLQKKLKYGEKLFNFRLSDGEISKNLKGLNLNSLKVVICGSVGFENFVKSCLQSCDVNKDCIVVL